MRLEAESPIHRVLELQIDDRVEARAGESAAGFEAGRDWSMHFDAFEGIKCYAAISGACCIAVEGVGSTSRAQRQSLVHLARPKYQQAGGGVTKPERLHPQRLETRSLPSSSVKNPESLGLAGVSDGFEVFHFAGMRGADSDYLAN